jgi:hypothetical protein
MVTASNDVKIPARDGWRFAMRLKDRLRPLASALPQLSGLPSWPRTMAVLKHHGFAPATVFDIGVGYGTFPLYRAFPNAFYHLVDPARESLGYMRRLSRRLRCQVHAVALGDREGETALEVRADIQESTVLTVKGGAEVESVVRFLGEHGFVLADIVGLRRRPLDNATAQLDLLFVPRGAAPRNDRRWAATA